MNTRYSELIIYVDVDDTFVRTFSTKRIPIPNVIRHIRNLFEQGAHLYCWSTGGAAYAEASAREFGIHDCFLAFLPKPDIMIDDQNIKDWRFLSHIHPQSITADDLDIYQKN